MKDSTVPYKRLPGSGCGFGTHVTLWQASDHMLMVRASSVGERYRRFFFRDIQAFFLRPSRRSLWNRIVFGVLVLFSGGGAAATDGAVSALLCSIAVILAVAFGADLVRGQTCNCYVKTAVQTERLVSLGRIRKAELVLERLYPLVREAQGVGTEAG